MSYDSRIYIIRRTKNEKGCFAEKIAMFDLCCMGYNNGWIKLFDTEIKYDIYIENGDTPTKTDRYGDTLKETKIENVIEWLENLVKSGDTYRRLKPCLAMLKGFNLEEWSNGLYIIHYGY